MTQPCDCWEPSYVGDMNGSHYCKNCGTKKKRDRHSETNQPKETCVEAAARETMERYWKMRAELRVVNSSVVDCDRPDCAWHDTKRERNCFRDPGDCRYIQK